MKESVLFNDMGKLNEYIEYIKCGHTMSRACGLCGIQTATMSLLLEKGRDDLNKGIKSKSADFVKAVDKAKNEYVHLLTERIKEIGMNGNWQSLAWLLERQRGEDFALKKDNGETTQTINVVMNNDVPKGGDK